MAEERADLFHSYDPCTTEDEYLHVIYSLLYALKPRQVLETGTWQGIGSSFMCQALKRNSIGHLTTIEISPKVAEHAQNQLRINGCSHLADVIVADSRDFLRVTHKRFDFAFFDSLLPHRCQELRICLERHLLNSGAMFAMHDTSKNRTLGIATNEVGKSMDAIAADDIRYDPDTVVHWQEFEAIQDIRYIHFPLSRGLTVGQVL